MRIAYQNNNVVLYHGDCREIIPTLKNIDAVVTDPPYALPTKVASGRSCTSNLGDLSIVEHYFRGLFNELWNVVSTKGQMFFFCDGLFYTVLSRAAYGNSNQAILVWDKCKIGMGREFRKSHELILRLWTEETPIVGDGTGHPDVIKCLPVSSSIRVHPAEKPVALISSLLWCCGTTILDPYSGSGSTLIAALETGHKAVGIEIDDHYVDIACNNLDKWHKNKESNLF